jgi:Cof subfamily protein (haloacid dehalogenase superfamily)
MTAPGDIELLISDIDGTLVTPDKTLTPAAAAAVRALAAAGVGFTVVSSRPPRGMAAIVDALDVRLPFGAFNGGNLVLPPAKLIEAYRLPPAIARRALVMLAERRISAWVFADGDWWLGDPNGPDVARERHTVGFDPRVAEDFEAVIARIDKIVGVSDDPDLLEQVEAEAKAQIGASAAIERSQPYYLDMTAPRANKGDAVVALCAMLGLDLARTAVIGDAFNDVAMFGKAGFSIAMGQAPAAVKARADAVTASNTAEGFAHAVSALVLPRASGRRR